jgi:hypothetical protein
MSITRDSLDELRRVIGESFEPANYRAYLSMQAREENRIMLMGGVPVIPVFVTIVSTNEHIEWLQTGEVRTI